MSTHDWPTDKNGNEINPGDTIHLDHNGMDRRVTGLTLFSDGRWGVSCNEGGSFIVTGDEDNVTVVGADAGRRKVSRVYVGSGFSYDVDGEEFDKKVNSAINNGAWGVMANELDYGRKVIFRLDSITHIVEGVDSSTMEDR